MDFTPSSAPLTVGAELEFQLLDADSLDLADGILPLMSLYPDSQYVKPEFVQNTVEIISPVCTDVDELHTHLLALSRDVHRNAAGLGMALCGAGCHPFSRRLGLITPLPRYQRMEEEAGILAHTQITFATHVHLGMTDGDTAVRLMGDLLAFLPLLIGLSANSPFWRGFDTGYAAYRHRILAAGRSYGVPPRFADWDTFCHCFETTRRAGLFDTINDIHWDIRPRPHLGSLEIRVMDAQPTVGAAMELAALLRLLAAYLMERGPRPAGIPCPLPWWIEKENHFHASRLGLEAGFIAVEDGTVTPLGEVWDTLERTLRPVAERLGETRRLAALAKRVTEGLPYQRQRHRYAQGHSFRDVAAALVDELTGELAGGGA